MAQGMLLAALPGVEGLCREHMAVVFGDDEALAGIRTHRLPGFHAGIFAGMREVVEGIHIFQQAALFQVANAGGGTAGV